MKTDREKHLARMEKHYRERGFDDGYAGKPAASREATYQQGWRRGMQARREDGLDDAA